MSEGAESHAGKIGKAIAEGLHGKTLALDDGGEVKLRWTGSRLLPDPQEAGVFHAVVSIRARTLT
jgi:hypothetical protein